MFFSKVDHSLDSNYNLSSLRGIIQIGPPYCLHPIICQMHDDETPLSELSVRQLVNLSICHPIQSSESLTGILNARLYLQKPLSVSTATSPNDLPSRRYSQVVKAID